MCQQDFVNSYLNSLQNWKMSMCSHLISSPDSVAGNRLGACQFSMLFLFDATPEGTKLTCQIEMQPGGILGLAEPLIAASLRREMEVGAGELKDLLENQAVGIT